MKIRTNDLDGELLDYAIALLEGITYTPDWSPSTNWNQGGPIFTKMLVNYGMKLEVCDSVYSRLLPPFKAYHFNGDDILFHRRGNSVLNTTMRFYALYMYGEEIDIDIPVELQ